jgi:Fe2+ transport system protein B
VLHKSVLFYDICKEKFVSMEPIYNIILAVLPSIVVFLTAFYIIKRFIDNEQRKHLMDIRSQNIKTVTPVRLQAYERIALFLERIAPDSLIMRLHSPGMSARQLQGDLLKSIRAEFEHNVAQQIYMTPSAWKAIRSAKEETIKLINIASSQIPDDAKGMDLGQKILQLHSQLEQTPTDFALDFVKREIKTLF